MTITLEIFGALLAGLAVFVGVLTPHGYRLRVLARFPLWGGMIVLELVLMLVGFVVCAIAHPVRIVDPADRIERTHWMPWWMWLWDNDIDGIDGQPGLPGVNMNWRAATAGWSEFRRRWVWSTWRNSVNNLRFTAIGRSPPYPDPPKGEFAYLTAGAKFWLCVPITTSSPWRELWLGWKPGAGFKSTITSLAKPGA